MASRAHNIALGLEALCSLQNLATAQNQHALAEELEVAQARVSHVWAHAIRREAFEDVCPVALSIARCWVELHYTLLSWAACQSQSIETEDDISRESALLRSYDFSMPEAKPMRFVAN